MIRCVFFIAIFIPTLSLAQDRGTVTVIKDPRIDTLIARRAGISTLPGSKSTKSTAVTYFSSSGYRVQIFSGPRRKDAYSAQAKFQLEHPGFRTYITYHEPHFKVHVGDYRTRIEAEKMVQELRGRYTSLFIIAEKINLPKADISND